MRLLSFSIISIFIFSQALADAKPKFTMAPKNKWIEDTSEKPNAGMYKYTLASDDTIAIDCDFIDVVLGETIKKTSAEKLAAQMLKGKKMILELAGAKDMKIDDAKYTKEGKYQIVLVRSSYVLKKEKFNVVEKYFILPNQTFLTSLRSSAKTKSANLVAAKADFETIHLE